MLYFSFSFLTYKELYNWKKGELLIRYLETFTGVMSSLLYSFAFCLVRDFVSWAFCIQFGFINRIDEVNWSL